MPTSAYIIRFMFLLLVSITCCQIIAQSLGEFVFPENTVVLRKNSAQLRCRSNSTSDVCGWKFKPAGAAEDVIIYRSRVIDNPNNTLTSFSVQKFYDGSVDLVTNSTQLSDAGLYICIICVNVTAEGALALIQQSAQLIVFDAEPNCETTYNVSVTANFSIEIRCTVSYRGNWAPVIEWRENEDSGMVIHDGIDTVTVSNVSITFMLSLLARNGVRFSCVIHFAKNLQNDSDDVKTMATNIPSYNYTWTSQRIGSESMFSTRASPSSEHSDLSIVASMLGPVVGLSALLVILLVSIKIRKSQWRGQGVEPVIENQLEEVINNRSRLGLPDVDNDYEDNMYADLVVDVADTRQPTDYQNNGEICGLNSNLADEASASSKKNRERVQLVGADGTEYLDMNGLEDQRQQRASDRTPQPCATEYALIDHNFKASELHKKN